jgi:hypothetical protein
MLTVVHAQTNGITTAFPDVCLTPSAPSPIPIPYPNISMSSDASQGSSSVKVDGQPIMLQDSTFSKSSGDEAGSAGGNVVTHQMQGPSTFMMYSFDVKVDGKPVCRALDIMVTNCMQKTPGTPPAPCVQPPGGTVIVDAPEQDEERGPTEIAWEGD